jgi:hypothetical protein
MSDIGRKDMGDSESPTPTFQFVVHGTDLQNRGPGEDDSRQPEVDPSADQGDPHWHR